MSIVTVELTDGDLSELADRLRSACREVTPTVVRVTVGGGVLDAGGAADPVAAGAAAARIRQTVDRAGVPSVITASGPVSGAGLAALLTFDVALCTPAVTFMPGAPAAALACGLSGALVGRIGSARTRAWLLTGQPMTAVTAQDWGLVAGVEPEGSAAAARLAAHWAASPAAGLLRRSVDAATRLRSAESREFDTELLALLREN